MTGQLPQPGQIFLGHVAHIVSAIVRDGWSSRCRLLWAGGAVLFR
jgi:hypothetical protein